MRTKTVTAETPEALAKALGLPGLAAQEWQLQLALLKRLRQAVQDEALTHAEVAQRAGSSRTRVTAILRGNLENVSTGLLIRLLGALGYRVRLSVSRAKSAA